MSVLIRADGAQAYVSSRKQQLYEHYSIPPVPNRAYGPTGQAIMERSNKNLREVLIEQSGDSGYHKDRVSGTLPTLKFLKVMRQAPQPLKSNGLQKGLLN